MFRLLLAAILMSATVTAIAAAQEANSSDGSVLQVCHVVSIDRVAVDNMQLHDTISIRLQAGGAELAAFDLRFGIANSYIDILEVLPGELLDSCAWEFFHARPAMTAGTEGYPSTLWKVVAMAETIPDSTRPVCYGLEREVSLVELVVASAEGVQVPDTAIPIFFYWETCSDNTFSGLSGDTVSISTMVVDYFDLILPESPELFPTRRGAPNQCVAPRVRDRILRQIEFHNGGVEFKVDLGLDSAPDDSTGQ